MNLTTFADIMTRRISWRGETARKNHGCRHDFQSRAGLCNNSAASMCSAVQATW